MSEHINHRILMLSAFDEDGGAAKSFMNYAVALQKAGHEVAMVVLYRRTCYPWVYQIAPEKSKNRLARFIEKHFHKSQLDICREQTGNHVFFYKENEFAEMPIIDRIIKVVPWQPTMIFSSLTNELVNTTSLLALSKFYNNIPVYFDAYDMNVFTGGCHVLWGCDGYKRDCSNCPAFTSLKRKKEVQESFAIKVRNIHEGHMGILYAGPYLLKLAKESTCFKDMPKFDIGMCIDTDLFTDANRDIAKRIMGLPEDAIVLFAGSENVEDKRKGVVYFFEALSILWKELPQELRNKIWIMVAGKNVEATKKKLQDLPPFHYHCIPYISDYRLLSIAYQASDVFVCSSIDDAGPMMVAEALSCGTPVVGFKMGLMYEQWFVKDGETGYVAQLGDAADLAKGLKITIMRQSVSFDALRNNCRMVALEGLSIEKFIKSVTNFEENIEK